METKSYKALGSNWFQHVFFNMFWDNIGDDVRMFVKKAFEYGQMNPNVVEYFVVLIPKVDSVIFLNLPLH